MSWRDNHDFNRVMDQIYSSFMKRKTEVEGRHDSAVRDPQIILKIARDLSLLPDGNKVIRITGSKGKGTTARMIARLLRAETRCDVALFLSPEEIDHNDRMRINEVIPTKDEFISIFDRISPVLRGAEDKLVGSLYLSPFGIFLLMALQYFSDNAVMYYVLEGGRGAKYDEVGNIPSEVSVLTSILLEHVSGLGPSLENIAENKLYIGTNSKRLICDQTVANWNTTLSVVPVEKLTIVRDDTGISLVPRWFEKDRALAKAAVEEFISHPLQSKTVLDDCSASFGAYEEDNLTYYYDACINAESIDKEFVRRLIEKFGDILFLASLPDDKDVIGIGEYFKSLGKPYYEISLSGTRGYLHYDQSKAEGRIIVEIEYDDVIGLKWIAKKLSGKHNARVIYFIGTQTYIRLVKMALSR